jgi:hypothetical protein
MTYLKGNKCKKKIELIVLSRKGISLG